VSEDGVPRVLKTHLIDLVDLSIDQSINPTANLDRCVESFPIARFRVPLGVLPGAYDGGPDFVRFVISPALLEMNGLACRST
jgi:hypothetical protein